MCHSLKWCQTEHPWEHVLELSPCQVGLLPPAPSPYPRDLLVLPLVPLGSQVYSNHPHPMQVGGRAHHTWASSALTGWFSVFNPPPSRWVSGANKPPPSTVPKEMVVSGGKKGEMVPKLLPMGRHQGSVPSPHSQVTTS